MDVLVKKLHFVNESELDLFVTVRSDKVDLHEEYKNLTDWKCNLAADAANLRGKLKFDLLDFFTHGNKLAFEKSKKFEKQLKWTKFCPTGEFTVVKGATVDYTLESNFSFGSIAYCTVYENRVVAATGTGAGAQQTRPLICKDYAVQSDVIYFRNNALFEYSREKLEYGDCVTLYNYATRRYLAAYRCPGARAATLADSPQCFVLQPAANAAQQGDAVRTSDLIELRICDDPSVPNATMYPDRWKNNIRMAIGHANVRFLRRDSTGIGCGANCCYFGWVLGKSDSLPSSIGCEIHDGDTVSFRCCLFKRVYLRAKDEQHVIYDSKLSKKRWWTIRKLPDSHSRHRTNAASLPTATASPDGLDKQHHEQELVGCSCDSHDRSGENEIGIELRRL